MKKYIFTISVLALSFLVSCGKEDPTPGSANKPDIAGKTKKAIFQMQEWRFASKLDSNFDKESSQISHLPCNLDDVYTFGATKISIAEGSLDCDMGLPATYDITWSMASDNATNVTIDGQIYKIVEQKNERIILTREFSISDDFLETFTLVRK